MPSDMFSGLQETARKNNQAAEAKRTADMDSKAPVAQGAGPAVDPSLIPPQETMSAFERAIFDPGQQAESSGEFSAPGRPASMMTDTSSMLAALKSTKDLEGAKKYMNVDAIGNVASQLKQQSKLLGYSWNNKAAGDADHTIRLASNLVSRGVTDIRKLRYEDGMWVMPTADGKKVRLDLKSDEVAANPDGNGYTKYKIQADPKGRPVFYPEWSDSSDRGKIAQGLAITLAVLAPGAGGAIGQAMGLTGTAASAAGNALLQTGLAAAGGAKGNNLLKSAVTGAVAPVVSSLPGISALPPALQRATAGAISGTIRGGTGKSALLGAVTGSLPTGLTGNVQLDRLLRTLVSQQIAKKVARP